MISLSTSVNLALAAKGDSVVHRRQRALWSLRRSGPRLSAFGLNRHDRRHRERDLRRIIRPTSESMAGLGSVSGGAGSNYNWHPGDWFATEGATFGCSVAQAKAEIDVLAADPAGVAGYVYMMNARSIEDFLQTTNLNDPSVSGINTQYPGIKANIEVVFNYLMQQCGTGMAFAMWTASTNMNNNGWTESVLNSADWSASNYAFVPHYVSHCGGNLVMPDYFGASTTGAFSGPVAPFKSGSSYYGFGFANCDGTKFKQGMPAFWNPVVKQYDIQMHQAIAAYVLLPSSFHPWGGMTIAQCPNFEFIGTNDEYSFTMTAAANFSSGTTQVNPPTSAGTSYPANSANYFAQFKRGCAAMALAFPKSMITTCFTYSFNCISPYDTPTTMAHYLNDKITGNTGYGLSSIRGVALSTSDFVANQWNLNGWTYPNAPGSFQGYIGIPNPPSSTPISGQMNHNATYDLTGIMPILGQVQPGDYGARYIPGSSSGISAYSTSMIDAIIQSMAYVNTTHRLWGCGDDSTWGNQAWRTYIKQAFRANATKATLTKPSSLN